jgi:hypothetical protein
MMLKKSESAKAKLKDKSENLAEKLNQVPVESEANATTEIASISKIRSSNLSTESPRITETENEESVMTEDMYDALFDHWDKAEFEPQDYLIDVPVDTLESAVGYSSLFRQLHQAYTRQIAFYKSASGGSLSSEEACAKAFHECANKVDAKKEFASLMGLPVEILNFVDLLKLHAEAPRVAERFWEKAKSEGRKEFVSGHLGANITFPVGYMKQVWNIARYLGVRDSFLEDWKPQGGIEIALIDMMTQSYFQWQYWLEQTVKRSETTKREEHPEYLEWQRKRKKNNKSSWTDGYWFAPTLSEQSAIDHAVQLADRFNRIFMRTLRQLRDLRRYSPVTINNPSQVNIAADGGQQINVTGEENETKKIVS